MSVQLYKLSCFALSLKFQKSSFSDFHLWFCRLWRCFRKLHVHRQGRDGYKDKGKKNFDIINYQVLVTCFFLVDDLHILIRILLYWSYNRHLLKVYSKILKFNWIGIKKSCGSFSLSFESPKHYINRVHCTSGLELLSC